VQLVEMFLHRFLLGEGPETLGVSMTDQDINAALGEAIRRRLLADPNANLEHLDAILADDGDLLARVIESYALRSTLKLAAPILEITMRDLQLPSGPSKFVFFRSSSKQRVRKRQLRGGNT
jgi:hypothetical protein